MVRKRRRGQALTEFAVAMPLFILLLMAIVDIACLLYQEGSFAYGLSEINWNLEYKQVVTRTLTQNERNALLKGAICSQLEVPEANVKVENAKFSKVTNIDFDYTVKDESNGVWSANEQRLNLRFEGDITCVAVLPIPILGWRDVHFGFELDRIVPYESQFEVSWYPERG